jgi:hypothetical protein
MNINANRLPTYAVRLYLSGPIEVAKQIIRQDALEAGLCVTIEPTTYIYTGGEEQGYVVGLLNSPRFPWTEEQVLARAQALASKLLHGTFQKSVLMVTPTTTEWRTIQ